MTVATRALFTGSFPTAEPRGLVVALTSAPDGGWTQVIEPRAIYRDGILYFAFIDGDDGHVKVGEWDGETTTLTTVGTAPEVDSHDAPVIHIRSSDDRLLVAWSGHDGPDMLLRISTNPLDTTAWGSEVNLDAQLGGTDYTYPSFAALGSTIYLFYRDRAGGLGRVAYSTSTDGGATWAAQTVLFVPASGRAYRTIRSNGSRLDVAVSSDHPLVSASTTHHLYTTGSGWLSSAGVSLGSPPFDSGDATLVSSDTPSWPHGVSSDGPTILYTVDDVTTTYYVATWSGSAWSSVALADAGALLGDDAPAVACLVDGDTAYASVKVAGRWELRRFDRGNGWAAVPITDGSSVDNIYPAPIHDAGDGQRRVLWLRGTFDAATDNSLAVWAGR